MALRVKGRPLELDKTYVGRATVQTKLTKPSCVENRDFGRSTSRARSQLLPIAQHSRVIFETRHDVLLL